VFFSDISHQAREEYYALADSFVDAVA